MDASQSSPSLCLALSPYATQFPLKPVWLTDSLDTLPISIPETSSLRNSPPTKLSKNNSGFDMLPPLDCCCCSVALVVVVSGSIYIASGAPVYHTLLASVSRLEQRFQVLEFTHWWLMQQETRWRAMIPKAAVRTEILDTIELLDSFGHARLT
ncbi:hypothetical protein BJ170DRAFT_331925 [Xylariales sp. AK1849]|nr:hypothetical protein BJ170DRAFT_331925 [Xylariales sp. AK1849]